MKREMANVMLLKENRKISINQNKDCWVFIKTHVNDKHSQFKMLKNDSYKSRIERWNLTTSWLLPFGDNCKDRVMKNDVTRIGSL